MAIDLSDEQLLRYSRQIMLDGFDIAGQQALLEATVLVVGLGGLGSPAAMYLAAAGIGRLVLADGDAVDLSNLQRQIAHATASIGQPKVESAAVTLAALNPEVAVETVAGYLDGEALEQAVANADVVVDATDNFSTRFALNRACVAVGRPLVSGAAIRTEAQLTVYDPRRSDSPCYRCLYSEQSGEDLACSEAGVIAPLVGVIGSLQALEVIKLVAGFGEPLVGRLLLFDGRYGEWRELKLARDSECPVCSGR